MLTAIMLIIFAISRNFNSKVILGGIAGAFYSILNFILLAITVEKMLFKRGESKSESYSRIIVRCKVLSYGCVRYLVNKGRVYQLLGSYNSYYISSANNTYIWIHINKEKEVMKNDS